MNLVILKVFLALLVIYSHSVLYVKDSGDNVFSSLGGYVAVNIFFFLSAYFLTLKYISSINIYQEITGRIRRLFPGGIMASLLVGLLLLSNIDISLVDLISIVFKNGVFVFGIEYNYICAFSCDQGGEKLNSSLWSMPFEVLFTLALIPFIFIGRKACYFKELILLLFVLLTIIIILLDMFSLNELTVLDKSLRVAFWFLFGIVIAVVTSSAARIRSSLTILVMASLLVGAVVSAPIALCFIIYTVATYRPIAINILQNFMTKNRPKLDPTYGAYLIGFPTQQLLYWQFGVTSIESLVVLTSLVAVAYGLFSNRYFETFGR